MTETLRLLLVEDNSDDAKLVLREIIQSYEFDLISKVVSDKNQFIKALCDIPWDLIICNFHLQGGLDAEVVLQVLEEYYSNIPVIIISRDMTQAQQAVTVQQYLDKNSMSRLIPLIQRELNKVKAQEEIIHSWGMAVEIKDTNTFGHTARVTKLAVALAKAMKLCWPDIYNIRLGAYLHDVGKIMVSDQILLKKGKLNRQELEQMQGHPVFAYQILHSIQFLRRAIEVPYCHHEHWDGSGYPRGLKGSAIPLSARIFAVADNYDAMTSQRSYREPLSKEFTLTFISLNAGKLFDPDVVKVFITMMKDTI